MTKKKYNRPKQQKDVSLEDTSEEEFNTVQIQGKSCPHVARGICFGRVKKSLKSTQSIVTCSGCADKNTNEELQEVWLCLQCGYRGCGRTSENKHALQHFKTLHSDCHSLVLSTTSGSIWCYDCDEEVGLQSSHVLKQCVEFVMKMFPNNSDSLVVSNVNKTISVKSLQNSVIKEEINVQNSKETCPVEKISNKSIKIMKESPQKIPIKGLRNLGNTCFFNAVMQNLNQTPLLYNELKKTCTPSHLWEVPELSITSNGPSESDNYSILKLSLPRQFSLTNSLLNFFEQMSAPSSSKVDVVNPNQLFGEISKKCPQFRHFQQQDSHELLRQLLDGVRQEEIKRQKKAILRHFDLENISPENVDEGMKKQIKAYGCYASHTIIEKVFGGLLISTVLCEECKMSSQVFEPFMDLSLPLFEEKQQENNEQLYGMLDGGKQDHIKPLRSKKVDWDKEDDVQGEYVLTKPKSDLGKPSKHQEKKQKQLARKEKKKARNRKNSQNENCDSSSNNQLKENVDNKKDDQKAKFDSLLTDLNDKNVDRHDKVENENENTEKLLKLCVEDEENLKNDSESTVKAYNCETLLNRENSDIHDAENSSDINNSKISCYQTIDQLDEEKTSSKSQNAEQKEDEIDVAKANEQESATFDDAVNNETNSKCSLSYCQNVFKNEENEINISNSNETLVSGIPDILGKVNDKEKKAISQNEKIKENDAKEIEELEENTVEILEELNDMNEVEQKHFMHEEEKINVDGVPVEDVSICNLAKELSNLKIDSSHSNIDERIHALSMQVKDVRFRRDSDRQENLLNSSDSGDDCESQKTNCTSPKSSIEDSCSIENEDNWSHSVSEQQTKDWISKTLTTLKPRHHVSPLECSINSCLSHFTKPELLTGNNKFRCENCTQLKIKKTGNKKDIVYSNASKQMLIFSPPAVLTLHLKRFQQVGMSLRKVNRLVEFPLILDLSPYCCSACSILPHMSSVGDEILYSLYGVVEHSGRLTSGHYVAYVRSNDRIVNNIFKCELPLAQCDLQQLLQKFSGANRESFENSCTQNKEDWQWFYISDSHVKEVSIAQVLKCQAYLLFYERIK